MNKKLTNDYLIATRIPSHLAAHAKEVAKTQGMPLSAFVRQAVKRNIESYIVNERNVIEQFV